MKEYTESLFNDEWYCHIRDTVPGTERWSMIVNNGGPISTAIKIIHGDKYKALLNMRHKDSFIRYCCARRLREG